MNLSDVDLDALLKRLHLANARRVWRELVLRAEKEQWSYRDFFGLVLSEEVAHRQQTRLTRLSRQACFPFLKTIDDFDFTFQSTVRLALLGSALSPDFITDGRNLVLLGKPGRGKTHLAVAISYRAIQNGFDALFVTAAELIDHLSSAFREGKLAQALLRYTHPHVLVIDEVGYLTYGTDAANMLFHVVNERHRNKRSMIFTTNKPFHAWGRVLHDEDLAHAIVDRVLERGRLLTLDGPSMRTKHLGLDDPTAPEASPPAARISGIPGAEFPEPTASSWSCAGEMGRRRSTRSPVISPICSMSCSNRSSRRAAVTGETRRARPGRKPRRGRAGSKCRAVQRSGRRFPSSGRMALLRPPVREPGTSPPGLSRCRNGVPPAQAVCIAKCSRATGTGLPRMPPLCA